MNEMLIPLGEEMGNWEAYLKSASPQQQRVLRAIGDKSRTPLEVAIATSQSIGSTASAMSRLYTLGVLAKPEKSYYQVRLKGFRKYLGELPGATAEINEGYLEACIEKSILNTLKKLKGPGASQVKALEAIANDAARSVVEAMKKLEPFANDAAKNIVEGMKKLEPFANDAAKNIVEGMKKLEVES